jgi:hypothetical protein
MLSLTIIFGILCFVGVLSSRSNSESVDISVAELLPELVE